ncbi:MAG TPA: GYD domain-containing protein [Gaiellaceae bacterium]|nr:GYD domain-containing protein [Gaiellaceae bacterium]
MAHYLAQVAYTPEAWASMVKNPQDRLAAVTPVIERLGGKLVSGWLAFGDYDIVAICDMPDNVSAAAFSMAASAGGSVKAFKTTPLLSIGEAVDAMRKAGGAGYAPPS